MDPREEKGAQTENRGFEALQELKKRYPDLILSVRRTSPGVDARGIDCFVRIKLPEGTPKNAMSVPIEFKSSMTGVEKWRVAHANLSEAGALIFHLPQLMKPKKVQRLIYDELMRVRKDNGGGTRFQNIIKRLFSGRKNETLRKNKELIREHRAREKERIR